MSGKQAQTLSPHAIRRMLIYASRTSLPDRNRVIVLLSVKAGLRACEIARLEWSMVLDARGRVGETISVHDRIAKRRSGRRIPIHPDLRRALTRLRRMDRPIAGPIVRSSRGGHMQPNSLVNWFAEAFAALGLSGCSSHSGRRTFITTAARALGRTGGSLRDIQLLAGHRSIETTQAYIDGDTNSQRKLISLI